jgi:hypothetical protein
MILHTITYLKRQSLVVSIVHLFNMPKHWLHHFDNLRILKFITWHLISLKMIFAALFVWFSYLYLQINFNECHCVVNFFLMVFRHKGLYLNKIYRLALIQLNLDKKAFKIKLISVMNKYNLKYLTVNRHWQIVLKLI